MHPKVEKALNEGRLKFHANGKYSYKASKEYTERFSKKETVYRDVVKKLDNLLYAFSVAEKRGKQVSHVSNSRIILV